MLRWNVFVHDMNKREITVYNVFNHGSFSRDLAKRVKEAANKEEFSELANRELSYYFWCKAEWEVLICPWCAGSEKEAIKVDVAWQVRNNWDRFVDYAWENRAELIKERG